MCDGIEERIERAVQAERERCSRLGAMELPPQELMKHGRFHDLFTRISDGIEPEDIRRKERR